MAESALSAAVARVAASILGGTPDDRRTAGRAVALGALAGAGWAGLRWVNGKLTTAGENIEQAHAAAPEVGEVTGGPGSTISWDDPIQGEPPLAVHDAARRRTSPTSWASRPGSRSGCTPRWSRPPRSQQRADLLLAEIDRTKALERSVFALFSPTGSGYVNYVATETLEYLTRGDCASAAIQYSVLPSALSLGKVHLATHQTRIVVNGIVQRLLAMPAERRPRFYLFGESLGSQVSQEMFEGQGLTGPAGIGLDAAVWIGTPAATVWRTEIAEPDITRAAGRAGRRLRHQGHPGLDRAVRRRPRSPSDSCCCRTGTTRFRSSRRRCCGVAPAGSGRTRPGRTVPRAAPAGSR